MKTRLNNLLCCLRLNKMKWFETLTSFCEEFPQQVQENITVDGEIFNGSDSF